MMTIDESPCVVAEDATSGILVSKISFPLQVGRHPRTDDLC